MHFTRSASPDQGMDLRIVNCAEGPKDRIAGTSSALIGAQRGGGVIGARIDLHCVAEAFSTRPPTGN